ncbi:MAG: ABC transporter ATP-binding protein [Bacteroidia bacterium]
MQILLKNIGKKYHRNWIFKSITAELASGNGYAVLGSNGSGKSTLLQIISGFLTPTSGDIFYQENNKTIQPDDFFRYLTLITPYMDIPDELSFAEILDFHFRFKKLANGIHKNNIPEMANMAAHKDKKLKYYSSGMKQRVRLSLALFCDSAIILLDEPTTHLDQQGIAWYRELIQPLLNERLLVISSNQAADYDFCNHIIKVEEFKPQRNEQGRNEKQQ